MGYERRCVWIYIYLMYSYEYDSFHVTVKIPYNIPT